MKWSYVTSILLCVAFVSIVGGIVAVILLARSGQLPGKDFPFWMLMFLAIVLLRLLGSISSWLADREEDERSELRNQEKLK